MEVVIRWTGEAEEEVKLAGEFNDWKPEAMERVEGGWSKSLKLSAGRYQYKFVVGDQWRVSSDLPTTTDHSGNVNNLMVVEESEGSGGDSDSWEKVSIPEDSGLTTSTNLQKICLVNRLYCFPGSYQEAVATVKTLGAELEEEKERVLTYYDTQDHRLQRAGVWLRSEGCELWEISRLEDGNLTSCRDQEVIARTLKDLLDCQQAALAVMASDNLPQTLDLSVRESRWVVGETSVEVVERMAGLVTVLLEEAGDLVLVTRSIKEKAESCNLSLYDARLATVIS